MIKLYICKNREIEIVQFLGRTNYLQYNFLHKLYIIPKIIIYFHTLHRFANKIYQTMSSQHMYTILQVMGFR